MDQQLEGTTSTTKVKKRRKEKKKKGGGREGLGCEGWDLSKDEVWVVSGAYA